MWIGVLPIQAFINGRVSYGCHIDPFSILMCKAKVELYDLKKLRNNIDIVIQKLNKFKRKDSELLKLANKDEDNITEQIPKIFNDTYWFKKYVLNDLGHVLSIIDEIEENKIFFQLCLGSITRCVSNADPVPISGLEITTHIKKRNNGRKIDLIGKYQKKLELTYSIIEKFNKDLPSNNRPIFSNLDIRNINDLEVKPNSIIFSPPYCNAIEYYRRHRLEYMLLELWNKDEIVEKSKLFVGSNTISMREESKLNEDINKIPYVNKTTGQLKNRNTRVFINKYFLDTREYLSGLSAILQNKGNIIIVIGDSVSEQVTIPTGEIILKIAKDIDLKVEKIYKYPIRNKRMNYIRRNGANIKTEKILLLHRK